jgi:aminoglycoside N3'-acetyltransferase
MGNTIIHFVEQLVKVDYRFHKIFKTKVYKNKKYISSGYSAFVRKKKIGPTNTIKIANIFRKKKLIKEIGNYKKLTNISIIDFKKCVKIMVQEYINNKEIFLNK